MDPMSAIIAFCLAVGLLTIMPGLDTALVLRTAAINGRKSAMSAAGGIALGSLAWGVVVALGLGALLTISHVAYLVLQFSGAAYLCFLGGKMIRDAIFGKAGMRDERTAPAPEIEGSRWLGRGFLTNILNPKVGVFYVSLLPQFIPAGANVALFSILLAAIHAAMGLAWFAVLTTATAPLSRFLAKPATARTLDGVTGTVLVAFGLRLALERRPA